MDLVQIIGQVGFPIAVASYCLIILNKSIQENTAILNKLYDKLDLKEEK